LGLSILSSHPITYITTLVIIRSNNQQGAIHFDSIGIGGAVHLPSTSTPFSATSHHSLSSGVSSSAALQMHMTETQVFAALRVVDERKGKEKGGEVMVFLDSTTQTPLQKDGVLLVSWVWHNDHPSVLWVNTFKESKVKTIR
jgi:hypothetical protein